MNLSETVRSCGVSFDVWEKRDADGKSSSQHDWTILLGSHKKHFLAVCTQKLLMQLLQYGKVLKRLRTG